MEAVLVHIWLREEAKLPTRRIREAREHFGGALGACRALKEGDPFFTPREREQGAKAVWEKAEQVLENCQKAGARAICLEEAEYPEALRQIYDPPAVLYLRGTMPQWEEMPVLAIVGKRKASPLGLETARRFAQVLSAHGFLIVSGLAQGVDGAAHQGALEGPTPTVAVLGTAIDQCYPASHNGLLRRILEKEGAVLSEYPPGRRGYPGYFPRRNRIISGLSLGVLVVEAARKSGSLITAATALEQERDVFVVPGSIDRPEYEGSNQLIRSGAILCTNPVEICEEYAGRFPGLVMGLEEKAQEKEPEQEMPQSASGKRKPAPAGLTGREKLIVDSMDGLTHIDVICQNTGLATGEVLTSLTMLQIRGVVRERGAKYFEII